MSTEDVSPRFKDLDSWPTEVAVSAVLEGQLSAAAACVAAGPAIARAVDAAAAVIGERGRLIYAGAGTSGRVAVQDGAELMPTFDWPAERVVFLLAGGAEAVTRSIEGAEDDQAAARKAVNRAKIAAGDVFLAVAASGRTPYTVAALQRARECGALTIAISSNARTPLLTAAHHPILVETGGEVLAGSTRMKAGTAQKIVLNAISTALMIRLGRIYRGYMVDMRVSNEKLRRRAVRMVADVAACGTRTAEVALDRANDEIKPAVLIARGMAASEARAALRMEGGSLRKVLERIVEPAGRSSSVATKPRIERIAQDVTEKVQAERKKQNGKAGEYRTPRR